MSHSAVQSPEEKGGAMQSFEVEHRPVYGSNEHVSEAMPTYDVIVGAAIAVSPSHRGPVCRELIAHPPITFDGNLVSAQQVVGDH